jgi:hypothetical protein
MKTGIPERLTQETKPEDRSQKTEDKQKIWNILAVFVLRYTVHYISCPNDMTFALT